MARIAFAHDQVAFPVTGHGPVLDLGRTLRDHHHVDDAPLTSRLARALGSARGSPLAQAAMQLFAQGPRPWTNNDM